MRSKSILASTAVAAALIAAVGTTAASHDGEQGRKERRLKADLRGFGEVPAVSTAARGSLRAVLSEDESEITYRLDYAGLQGNVLQAHIHVGDHHTNGGVSVWLCGNPSTTPPVNPPAGTPPCPPSGDGPEASGTIAAAHVVGPAAQLIAPGELAELVRAIKSGVTYANVHTTLVPSGEIRGQIRVD